MFKKITVAQDFFVIFLATCYLLIFFNTQNFAFSHFIIDSFKNHFLEIIVVFCLLNVLFLLLSFSSLLLKITLSAIFFCSVIYLYVFNKFGTILDENIISNALLSMGHVSEIIDNSLFSYFFFFAFLPSFLLLKTSLQKTNYKIKIGMIILFLLIIGSIISFHSKHIFATATHRYAPVNYFSSVIIYLQRFSHNLKAVENRIDITKQIKFDYQKTLPNLNIVLVIGESLRVDHLQIYGYNQKTTPNLAKINNLLKFKVLADFNLTSPSVNSLLSHRLKAEYIDIPPETSIISVFKKFGFETYWYSSQSSKEFGNGILNILGIESDYAFYRDYLLKNNPIAYDETLLPHVELIDKQKNNFIILHTFGSHIRFHDRYPNAFEIFRPACQKTPSSCQKQELVNAYNNTVLYTDYFLSKLFQKFNNTNAIIFFISDHGQFLGEENIYGNGNNNTNSQVWKSAHTVPMFIYASPKIWQNKFFQQKLLKAQKNTANKNLNQDIFFDTVLDCSGFSSKLLSRNLSVCGDNLKQF
jgi:KDO II ethanolaminephosphotransferase